MADSWTKIGMTREEFRLLRDLVYEYCGIFFQDEVKYLLERRLNARLREHTLNSFNEYYRYLRYSPSRSRELEEIVELLTTNETYFFREEYQLKAFSDEILPEVVREHKGSKRLRIWSAGCSTGEEAYTIAILLRENPELSDWDVEIFANDISRKVIQRARKGEYGRSSFRSIGDAFHAKYFRPQGEHYVVTDELRSLVSFGQLNLLDDEMLQLIGKVDVIFCRNVLIYFDRPARLRVLSTFYDKLNERGYLLLGHSESLMNVSTDFELVHLKNDLVYRKPSVAGEGRSDE
ncbi:CheR family methyltransferase [Myxococcota bacterium]